MSQKVSNIFVKINQLTPRESDNPKLLRKLLRSIAQELKYTILKSSFHKFKPTGFTGILLLSESHISIHTWPEENFAALEMVTCKLFSTKEKSIVIDAIKKILNTSDIDFTLNV